MHPTFDCETPDQADERQDVEWAVIDGRLTPDDAEAWAQDNKRLPFYLAGLADKKLMSSLIWRLPIAAIWIAFRSSDPFEIEVAAHTFWREHTWRNPMKTGQLASLLQGETTLRAALLGGELNAFGNMAWNRDYLSRGPTKQINRNEWIDLVWTRTADGVLTDPIEGEPRYLDALVFRDEVLRIWPEKHLVKVDLKPRIGRPPGTGLVEVDRPIAERAAALVQNRKFPSIVKAVNSLLAPGTSESESKRIQRLVSKIIQENKGDKGE